jgi:hypothetical protein
MYSCMGTRAMQYNTRLATPNVSAMQHSACALMQQEDII